MVNFRLSCAPLESNAVKVKGTGGLMTSGVPVMLLVEASYINPNGRSRRFSVYWIGDTPPFASGKMIVVIVCPLERDRFSMVSSKDREYTSRLNLRLTMVPAASSTVHVYMVSEVMSEGVPLIVRVDLSMVSPVGRLGVNVYSFGITPPDASGRTKSAIAIPTG